MDTHHFVVESTPSAADTEFLSDRLYEYIEDGIVFVKMAGQGVVKCRRGSAFW